MCGIAGYIDLKGAFEEAVLRRAIEPMMAALVHRGPDDGGFFIDREVGFGLGFRRLSIIDLSIKGHQPMRSFDDRYVVAFNGEIYNFREIRVALEAEKNIKWRGTSDTEVLLAAVCRYGIKETLEMLDGMFAIALWDCWEKTLYLARDRMGEKPLYYGWQGKTLLFGSELKALSAHPDWNGRLNEPALQSYMRFSYVPAPASIYRGIYKLRPGHIVTLRQGALTLGRLPKSKAYWDAKCVFDSVQENPFEGSQEEAASLLEQLLADSVERRLIADVPLGIFLSGGIDSSTIAALAQKISAKKVLTFTIGFTDPEYNEAKFARSVAEHIGTDHTELIIDTDSVMKCVERVPRCYDEPFADVSQLPTILLSELTREHVTAVLSGDGGDELFGGYPRYQSAVREWQKNEGILKQLAEPLNSVMPYDILNDIKGLGGRPARLGDKLFQRLNAATANAVEDVQMRYLSRWRTAQPPINLAAVGFYSNSREWAERGDDFNRLTFADTMTYLPDDLLVKLDRASMAVALEVRTPFLNHDLVKFAWSLPSSFKFQGDIGKSVLRNVLYKYVPPGLSDRPKQGFEPPLADWLRGPLRDWAEDLLGPDRIPSDGWLDPQPVQAIWDEHLKGHRNWQFELWNILMLQAWRSEWNV
ncbi:MAG: asparagine synthase (glutamine-hydrolyzing) [Rhodospirillaceae bacterium]|nr:asparagine synthase (glutamine-hydrolyzing) [Rhodospirillaceae bacterium]MBE89019.1 asparagine synthase (glutamine-hydrolyzing) [Rhodospirillaceae bacterium]